jgi:hypothetical protein
MRIHQLADDPGELAYYEPEFLNMVESHFTYLRGLERTATISVKEGDAYRFEGDFHGLLNFLRVPKQYHLVITTFNGLRHPADYDKDNLLISIPPLEEIDLLKAVYETSMMAT